MLDVNDLRFGDILVLNNDCISQQTGRIYRKGTEAVVVKFTIGGGMGVKPLYMKSITLQYSDGENVLVSGRENIASLVAHLFHRKTEHNINLKIGDVFKVEETLLIRHCGITVWVDAVEVKVTGLKRGNCNFEITDVDGTVWLYSKHLSKFINEIAVKNVKLRNEEKQEVKRIDIYSDRTTPQVGDIIVSCDVDDLNMVNNVYGVVVDKVDRIKTGWLCEFEGTLVQDIPKMTQHIVPDWAFKNGTFKIVNHRNVPEDFIPYEEVEEFEYVATEDVNGVVGKKYFIHNGKDYLEVICTESNNSPICINAETFGYLHYWEMSSLFEKKTVTKRIPIATTASVTLK